MTDNEIVKALERCNGLAPTDEVDCELCPFCDYDAHKKCTEELAKNVLDLIKRQKAEIERLTTEKDNLIRTYAECQIANIKEFAERLNGTKFRHGSDYFVYAENIDNLVKEMTEENSNG